jgi:hypothetical protein
MCRWSPRGGPNVAGGRRSLMKKIIALAALSLVMVVGCKNMNHDDDMNSDTKKMSVEGKTGCAASCDKAKAK